MPVLLVCQVPIGELKIGLARHRALLFKFLADSSNLKSRILRGSYTGWRAAGWVCMLDEILAILSTTLATVASSVLSTCHPGTATADTHCLQPGLQEAMWRCNVVAVNIFVLMSHCCLRARADGPDDRAVAIVQVAGEELLVQLISAPIGQCRPLASADSTLRLIPRNAPNLAQVSLRVLLPARSVCWSGAAEVKAVIATSCEVGPTIRSCMLWIFAA